MGRNTSNKKGDPARKGLDTNSATQTQHRTVKRKQVNEDKLQPLPGCSKSRKEMKVCRRDVSEDTEAVEGRILIIKDKNPSKLKGKANANIKNLINQESIRVTRSKQGKLNSNQNHALTEIESTITEDCSVIVNKNSRNIVDES